MELTKLVKDFGLPGIIGILIGLGLVWWVAPTTPGGTALLIALPVLVCVAVAKVLGLFGSKGSGA